MAPPETPSPSDRRDFLTKAAAVVIGGACAVAAPVAGLVVAFDPLRRSPTAGSAVFVTSLDALPENGEPRQFSISRTQVDIWNRTPNVPVGAVYLQRLAGDKVRALNAKCPHTGCFVNHKAGTGFHCPCHDSTFTADGKILNADSPSPRPLDELEVEVREGGEIWVRFQNYRTGVTEKIPV
jgi:menaquinol-cytochrome c reductase iron-sulfur subunit